MDREYIESADHFGYCGYCSNTDSSNPRTWTVSPLFIPSLIYFINILSFSVYISLVSLVKFIPRNFIISAAVVSGISFLISLSDSLLVVYRNTTDLCTLILSSEMLQHSRIYSQFFWCGVFRVFYT